MSEGTAESCWNDECLSEREKVKRGCWCFPNWLLCFDSGSWKQHLELGVDLVSWQIKSGIICEHVWLTKTTGIPQMHGRHQCSHPGRTENSSFKRAYFICLHWHPLLYWLRCVRKFGLARRHINKGHILANPFLDDLRTIISTHADDDSKGDRGTA